MTVSLRLRFSVYAIAGAGYLAGLIGTMAFVAIPSLLRVDRSLAPLQSVFTAISERQRVVNKNIELLDRLIQMPQAPSAHKSLPTAKGAAAPASLLSVYGGLLGPEAARKLAVAEDKLAAIESGFGEALARYEIGDRAGASARLLELRRAEDDSQQDYNQVMMLALSTGVEARAAFREAAGTLAWLSAGWMVLGALLVLLIAYDANRHIWQPIRALDAGVRQIATGDWSRPVRVEPGDELGDLAAQFNALTGTLQQRAGQHAQLATAGELLAGVAHELNNPLQAIRGTAELRATGEPGNRDWATVLAQAERASKLARDLVAFVRPAGRMVEMLSITSVLRSAVDLIDFQFRADGIGLEVEAPEDLPAVRADAHELIQVIVNILGNAHAELAGAAGPRRVFVRAWAEGDRVYCRVLDTGLGIPPELHDRIFNPFFSAKQTGVGLGLTVSRHLVRASGGDLVLDENGPGASFTLWLPAHPVSPAPVAAPGPSIVVRAAPVNGLTGLTVLLADDEPAIRGVLERFFEREGARVITVAGGKAALEAIAQRSIDVAVLDLRMPDLDGASVYRIIKEQHPDLASRVIFLSGDVSRVTEELDVPGNRVLVKPVELGDLRRAVGELAAGLSVSRAAT